MYLYSATKYNFVVRPEFEVDFGLRSKSRNFAWYSSLEVQFRLAKFLSVYRKPMSASATSEISENAPAPY